MDGTKQEAPLYVITSGKTKPGRLRGSDELLGVDADERMRVLFRTPIETSKLETSFRANLELAKRLVESVATLGGSIEFDSLTLKLGVDAEVGCILLGDASIEASLEIKIRKVQNPGQVTSAEA